MIRHLLEEQISARLFGWGWRGTAVTVPMVQGVQELQNYQLFAVDFAEILSPERLRKISIGIPGIRYRGRSRGQWLLSCSAKRAAARTRMRFFAVALIRAHTLVPPKAPSLFIRLRLSPLPHFPLNPPIPVA